MTTPPGSILVLLAAVVRCVAGGCAGMGEVAAQALVTRAHQAKHAGRAYTGLMLARGVALVGWPALTSALHGLGPGASSMFHAIASCSQLVAALVCGMLIAGCVPIVTIGGAIHPQSPGAPELAARCEVLMGGLLAFSLAAATSSVASVAPHALSYDEQPVASLATVLGGSMLGAVTLAAAATAAISAAARLHASVEHLSTSVLPTALALLLGVCCCTAAGIALFGVYADAAPAASYSDGAVLVAASLYGAGIGWAAPAGLALCLRGCVGADLEKDAIAAPLSAVMVVSAALGVVANSYLAPGTDAAADLFLFAVAVAAVVALGLVGHAACCGALRRDQHCGSGPLLIGFRV